MLCSLLLLLLLFFYSICWRHRNKKKTPAIFQQINAQIAAANIYPCCFGFSVTLIFPRFFAFVIRLLRFAFRYQKQTMHLCAAFMHLVSKCNIEKCTHTHTKVCTFFKLIRSIHIFSHGISSIFGNAHKLNSLY